MNYPLIVKYQTHYTIKERAVTTAGWKVYKREEMAVPEILLLLLSLLLSAIAGKTLAQSPIYRVILRVWHVLSSTRTK